MPAENPPVVIVLDWGNDEPVYVQIAGRIRASIVAGELRPGTALPAVRVLASDLGVNLNTVARAYRLLEDEGFLRIRDRSGAEVLPPGAGSDAESRGRLSEELRGLLARMRQVGFSLTDLKGLALGEIAALARRS